MEWKNGRPLVCLTSGNRCGWTVCRLHKLKVDALEHMCPVIDSKMFRRKYIPIVCLLSGFILIYLAGWDSYISISWLRENHIVLTLFVHERYFLSVAIFCSIYALTIACSMPTGMVLTLGGGFLFGTVFGALFSVIGATAGAIILFIAARTAFKDLLIKRAEFTIDRMRSGFQTNALFYLIFLRLIPIFPFFIVNLVPAVLGVKLGVYLVGTVIGIIPGAIIFAMVGSGLSQLFAAGEEFSLSTVLTLELTVGLIGLAFLSLLPIFFRGSR